MKAVNGDLGYGVSFVTDEAAAEAPETAELDELASEEASKDASGLETEPENKEEEGEKMCIRDRHGARRVDYEAELAIVIGKKAKCVPVSEAKEYIFGYTCLNDVTEREIQKRDGQWTRGKGFDTFAPVGPCIETELRCV